MDARVRGHDKVLLFGFPRIEDYAPIYREGDIRIYSKAGFSLFREAELQRLIIIVKNYLSARIRCNLLILRPRLNLKTEWCVVKVPN